MYLFDMKCPDCLGAKILLYGQVYHSCPTCYGVGTVLNSSEIDKYKISVDDPNNQIPKSIKKKLKLKRNTRVVGRVDNWD